MSYGSIAANYVDFCGKISALGPVPGGTVHTETYNNQTPDKVKISAFCPGDNASLSSQVGLDECKTVIKNLVNGCDVPSNRNPLNYTNGRSKKFYYKVVPSYSTAQPTVSDPQHTTVLPVRPMRMLHAGIR